MKVSKLNVVIMSVMATAGIWSFDYFVVGRDITVILLYLVPIFFATWYAGLVTGLFIAALSTMAWFTVYIADAAHRYLGAVVYVDLGLKLAVFIFFVVILSSLKKALERERETSRMDFTTGAANGRSFIELLNIAISGANRDRTPVTVAYMDIDNFKEVNDTLGHNAGDKVLKQVVKEIKQCLRATDVVARLGGDEFGIILPRTGYRQGATVIKKISVALFLLKSKHNWPITFSIGAATCVEMPPSSDDFIKLADKLMYSVKNGGKNDIRHENCKFVSPSFH